MMTGRWLFLTVATLIFVPITAEGQARVEKNVLVGMHSGLALVMDVHHSENPNGYGIVHISGSGWRRPLAYSAPPLSERQVDLYGQPLVERGYTVFSLNHRATPRFQFPAPLEDVQRAVRFVRYHAAEYGIDPDRIGAVGGSSGGHLVSMLGVLDGHGDSDDPDPVNRVSAKVQTVVARAAPISHGSRLRTEEAQLRSCWEHCRPKTPRRSRPAGTGRHHRSTTRPRTIPRSSCCMVTLTKLCHSNRLSCSATRSGQRKWRLASYRFPARVMDRHSLARWTRQTTSAQ